MEDDHPKGALLCGEEVIMDVQEFELTVTLDEGQAFVVDFHQEGLMPLAVDEAPPLGEGRGPNPARLLAAAVGHCLTASALFCFRKARLEVTGMRTTVRGRIVRNERGRLRIGRLDVRLEPEVRAEDRPRMGRCLELFEDFCTVTQSVRDGIDVKVEVVTPGD